MIEVNYKDRPKPRNRRYRVRKETTILIDKYCEPEVTVGSQEELIEYILNVPNGYDETKSGAEYRKPGIIPGTMYSTLLCESRIVPHRMAELDHALPSVVVETAFARPSHGKLYNEEDYPYRLFLDGLNIIDRYYLEEISEGE